MCFATAENHGSWNSLGAVDLRSSVLIFPCFSERRLLLRFSCPCSPCFVLPAPPVLPRPLYPAATRAHQWFSRGCWLRWCLRQQRRRHHHQHCITILGGGGGGGGRVNRRRVIIGDDFFVLFGGVNVFVLSWGRQRRCFNYED